MGYHRPVSSFNVGQAGRARGAHAVPGARRRRSRDERRWPIAGLTPLSSCDWPGRLVATVVPAGLPVAVHVLPQRRDPRPAHAGHACRGRTCWTCSRAGTGCSTGSCSRAASRPGRRRSSTRRARCAPPGFGVGLHTAGAYPRRLRGGAPAGRLGGVRRQGAARGCTGAITRRRRADDERRRDVRVAAARARRRASTSGPDHRRPDRAGRRRRRGADRRARRPGRRRPRAAAGPAGRDDGRVPGGPGQLTAVAWR